MRPDHTRRRASAYRARWLHRRSCCTVHIWRVGAWGHQSRCSLSYCPRGEKDKVAGMAIDL